MAEELIVNINVSGEENLNNVDKKLTDVTKTTNKTQNAFAAMRREMRDAKADMLTYAEGTKEYNAAMQRAAASADKMRDITDKIKASQRDVGVIAKNVAGSVAGLAGAFSTAQGVIALFGVENDAVAQTLLKVQAALSVASGISQMADSIDNLKDLFGALKTSVGETSGELGKFNANAAVVGSNLAGNKANVDQLSSSVEKMSQKTSDLTQSERVYLYALKRRLSEFEKLDNSTGKYSASIESLKDQIEELTSETKVSNEVLDKSSETVGKVGKGITSLGKTIVSTMGYMVLFTAIIAGVTYGITKLIEWINKVPEDVKIKLSLEEDAAKKMGNEYTKVMQFTNDINKAKRDGDKEALKRLEEYGEKEFGLSKDRLKMIEDNKTAWRKAFKDYLKTAQDTYYNEALMKQKTDLLVSADVNLAKINTLKERYNELRSKQVEMQTKGTGGITIEELFLMNKIEKDLKTLREERHLMAEQGKALQKLQFRDVYSDAGESIITKPTKPTKPTTPTTSTTPTPAKRDLSAIKFEPSDIFSEEDLKDLQKAADKYQAELKRMYDTTLHYTNEEKLIMYQALKDKNKLFSLTETQVANYNLKMVKARKKDLENTKESLNEQLKQAAIIQDKDLFDNIKRQLEELDVAIADTSISIVEATRNKTQAVLSEVSNYLNIASDLANSFVDIYQYKMDAVDSLTEKEIERINLTNASEEEKTRLIEIEEQKRYDLKAKLFEKQKDWQKANAWIAFASGTVGIWSQSLQQLGPIAGPIVAGVETAALLATTIAQTNAISKQKIDAPSKGSSTTSSSVTQPTTVYQSLSPTSTSMTTSTENLNLINGSNKQNVESVVKVSDINRIQSKVSVRDNNRSY